MRLVKVNFLAACIFAIVLCWSLCPNTTLAFDVYIDVAPNVLNIQSEGEVVTVHTDIAYSTVVGSSVFLNGVAIDFWKSDLQGNFVAKFESEQIKTLDGLIIGGYNQFVLTGFDTDGEAFIGTQEIWVIDNAHKGKD